MQADGLNWDEGYRPLGRQVLAEIIEAQIAAAVDGLARWRKIADAVSHRGLNLFRSGRTCGNVQISRLGQGVSVQGKMGIKWDGKALTALIDATIAPVVCVVPRDTIHRISIYMDAIDREIERDKSEIFDRLLPIVAKKIERGDVDRSGSEPCVRIEPSDLDWL